MGLLTARILRLAENSHLDTSFRQDRAMTSGCNYQIQPDIQSPMASSTLISIVPPVTVIADSLSALETESRLTDSHGRAITDLRISVTDRCNYKCVYCRTGEEGVNFTELPIEHYLRMIRIFVSLGIEKVRITGGEPLLRSGLVDMVSELAQMRTAYP